MMARRRKVPIIPEAVEPQMCPEAVRWWMDGVAKYEKKSMKVREAARKHMSAMGWKFWHAKLKGDKPVEFRYQSPAGKLYYSLKTACKACVELDLTGLESIGSNSSPNSPMEECNKEPKSCTSTPETKPKKRGRKKKTDLVVLKKRGRKRKIDIVMPEEEHQSSDVLTSDDSDPRYHPMEDCKEAKSCTGLGSKPKKRGRKRKIDLVTPEEQESLGISLKPGKVLAELKRLRVDDYPKLQIRSPRTILSSFIDNMIVTLNTRVYCRGRKNGDIPLARGQFTREGIVCDCCSRVFALTAFEAHAGSPNHRPGANIILEEDGRATSDCQQQMKSFKDEKKVVIKKSSNKSDKIDDLCSVCHNEGKLILCDRCPSSFHTGCLGLSEVADGAWFPPACCCGICGSGKLEEGTIPGEIRKCDQCERRYPLGCLNINDVVSELVL